MIHSCIRCIHSLPHFTRIIHLKRCNKQFDALVLEEKTTNLHTLLGKMFLKLILKKNTHQLSQRSLIQVPFCRFSSMAGQPPPAPMIRAYFDHWFPLQGLLKPSFLGGVRDQGGWLTNAINSRLAGGQSWVLHLTGIKELSRSEMFSPWNMGVWGGAKTTQMPLFTPQKNKALLSY